MHKLVLGENRCESLEEVAEKYARAMKKRNPGKSEEELNLEPPLAIWVEGKLQYRKRVSSPRKPNRPYRSTEYSEFLGGGPHPTISLKTAKGELAGFVDYLSKELGKRFPKRKGKMPDHPFERDKRKRRQLLYNNLNGFSFGLNFQSMPTGHLQASVCLINFGSVFSGDDPQNGHHIPAIQIKAEYLVRGSMAPSRRVVEALGEVVANHYTTGNFEHKTSYSENPDNYS